MSWQVYVDNHLLYQTEKGNQLTSAAILGQDGSVWAQSPNFPQVLHFCEDVCGQLFTTITVDEPAPGLKTILSFKVPDQRSGKLGCFYPRGTPLTLDQQESRILEVMPNWELQITRLKIS